LYATAATYGTNVNESLVPNCVPPVYLKHDIAYIRMQNAFQALVCAVSDVYGFEDIRFQDELYSETREFLLEKRSNQ